MVCPSSWAMAGTHGYTAAAMATGRPSAGQRRSLRLLCSASGSQRLDRVPVSRSRWRRAEIRILCHTAVVLWCAIMRRGRVAISAVAGGEALNLKVRLL